MDPINGGYPVGRSLPQDQEPVGVRMATAPGGIRQTVLGGQVIINREGEEIVSVEITPISAAGFGLGVLAVGMVVGGALFRA